MIRVIRRSRVRLLAVALACTLPSVSLAQVPQPPVLLQPEEPEEPSTGAAVPLSWNDPAFAKVSNSAPLTLNNGAVRSNLSITSDGNMASVCCGSYTLNNVRINSREAIRAGGGDINLNWVWAESKGVSGDHADSLQCYGPGRSGKITAKNSTFRAYSSNATAGYFSSDDWRGDHVFDNVLFWGGPYGLRINCDGGNTVSLNNVYFVEGSFQHAGYMLNDGIRDYGPCGGRGVTITKWNNVRNARIENGKLVVGKALPPPCTPPCTPNETSGGGR